MPGEKRGVLTLRPSLFLTVILLLLVLLICINPVSAYTPASGEFSYSGGVVTNQTITAFAGGADNGLYGIYFRSAKSFPSLGAVKLYSELGVEGYGTAWFPHPLNTTVNSSSLPASLKYAGSVVSTGTLYWSLSGVTGDMYIAYFPDTWDPFTVPDRSVLYLEWDRTKFNWQFGNMGRADQPEWENNLFAAGFTFTPWNANPANIYMPITYKPGFGHFTDYYDTWQFQYNTVQQSTSLSYLDLIREINNIYYVSRVMVNESFNGINTTIYNNWGSNNTRISAVSHDRDIYLTIWDPVLRTYSSHFIIRTPIILNIQLSKGGTSSDPTNIDTAITATVTGTTGSGFKYFTWEWSENWDEFFSSTSSMKIGTTYYRSFMYNSTNTTSGGNWELYGKGFSRKSDAPTSSTLLGSYTWAQIKSQSIQFNWTQYEPSWNGQAGGRISPYNYVSVRVSDDNAIDLAYIEKPVYVIKSVDTGQFQIWIRDYTWGTHIYDANLWIFDTTIGSWVYNKVNVTQSSYTTDVTIGHTYFIWAGKAGYQFIQGVEHPENIIQQPINGCVTYSALSASVKELSLILAGTAGANGTAIFRVETLGGIRISNAKITITSHQTSDIVYTDATGMVYFQTIRDLNYQYIVEHTGAGCLDKVIGEFPSSTDQYLSIIMEECTEIPTITPTLTPSPTSTLLPGPGEPGGDLISSFVRLFQMAGAGTVSNAKLMLALVVCSALAFIFGYYLSFQASLIGAFIGFVFSLAFGLIPMWILIALIIIGGVLFAGKWWSGSGGG